MIRILPTFFSTAVILLPLLSHAQGLENPLRVNSITELLAALLNILTILMIPIVVFFIILAGFRYVMAQGNSTQVSDATRALTYAIIGGVLILAAQAITVIIQATVDEFAR